MALFTNKGTGYVARRNLRDFSVGASTLDDGIFDGSFAHVVGDHSPRATTAADSTTGASSWGPPTGVAADINRVVFAAQIGHAVADNFVIGTQTILGPVRHATLGINISQDATNNDGIHYTFGGNVAYNPHKHVVGTTPESRFKIKLYIEDADGTDQMIVGWRKQEAETADPNDFNDMAAIGDLAAAFKVMEIQTNAATVTSASLGVVADATAYTFEVRVRKNGAVSYFIDGVQKNPGTTYQFTTGLTLVPFLAFIQDTNVTELYLQDYQVGRAYTFNQDGSSETVG